MWARSGTGGTDVGEADVGEAGAGRAELPLASHLKTGTAAAHKDAESVAFVRAFLKGKISVDVYRQLVANL